MAGVLTLVATLASSVSIAGAAQPLVWSAAIELAAPFGEEAAPHGSLESVSCASAGYCSAVGHYPTSTAGIQTMVANETNGAWGAPERVAPPSDAAEKNPDAELESVSCYAPGACVAVGHYLNTSGQQALVATEMNGVWSAETKVTLPTGASKSPGANLDTVSCSSQGSCGAVGSYTSSAGVQAMGVTVALGTLGAASKVTSPADVATKPRENLQSVSCAAIGSCTAVGYYESKSAGVEAMVVQESEGVWGAGSRLTLPEDAKPSPAGDLEAVSCSAPGSCGAAGMYLNAFGYQAMVVSETGGAWGTASEVSLPANAGKLQETRFYAISCPAAGQCAAVGDYYDNSAHDRAMTVTEANGAWGPAIEPTPPAGAATDPEASLRSVSCAAAGSCAAVGDYEESAVAPATAHQAMDVSETNGVWGPASEVALPAGAKADSEAGLQSISCASSGLCAGVGFFTDSAGDRQGLAVSATPGPTPPGSSPPSSSPGTGRSSQPVPVPAIVLKTSSPLLLSKRLIAVQIACQDAPCAGTIDLTRQIVVQVEQGKTEKTGKHGKHGKRRVAKRETVVLAAAGYELAAGTSETVELRLTTAGVKALKYAGKHNPVKQLRLTATVRGGAGAAETVRVS